MSRANLDEKGQKNRLVLASVRAHRRVFERLGFFAEGHDGNLFAFDLQGGSVRR